MPTKTNKGAVRRPLPEPKLHRNGQYYTCKWIGGRCEFFYLGSDHATALSEWSDINRQYLNGTDLRALLDLHRSSDTDDAGGMLAEVLADLFVSHHAERMKVGDLRPRTIGALNNDITHFARFFQGRV